MVLDVVAEAVMSCLGGGAGVLGTCTWLRDGAVYRYENGPGFEVLSVGIYFEVPLRMHSGGTEALVDKIT